MYKSKIYASGLIGLPVMSNGNHFGVCGDIAINPKNKELTFIILSNANRIVEIGFERVEIGSGILILK